jgi:hypothetical protein
MLQGLRACARCTCIVTGVILTSSLVPGRAHARRFFRARFETETLELEKPGEIELDTQLGGLYGDGPDGNRLIAPDFEADVGITRWLELDVGPADGRTGIVIRAIPRRFPSYVPRQTAWHRVAPSRGLRVQCTAIVPAWTS